MHNARFHSEPPIAVEKATLESPHPRETGSSDTLPLWEAVLLGLHFRDFPSENERAHLKRLASPASYFVMTLGERVLVPRNLPPQVLESLSPTALRSSDAVFTHRSRIHDHDVAFGVVHMARIGQLNDRDLMLGVCQPDDHADRHRQFEEFSRTVATVRIALEVASEAAHVLKSRLSADHEYLLVNRASGRVISASETISRALGCVPDRLSDLEYSDISTHIERLFRTGATRMENIAVGDMNLALVTFQPEARKDGLEGRSDVTQLAEAIRGNITAITAASDDLRQLTGRGTTETSRQLVETIVSHAGDLSRCVESYCTGLQENSRRDRYPRSEGIEPERRSQHSTLHEKTELRVSKV